MPTSTLLPLELNLTDGEQSVILSGQAGLAVEFNQVGEEQFVTLRIRAGSTSRSHAILSSTATKSYEIELQGEEYYVSVLRIDHQARSVRLRVDRKRDL